MNINHKVIVIGLDGASPEIFFDKWEDELPNLKKIRERGLSGPLLSSVPPVTAPAWASFATGCNPGKHSIYDFLYRDEETHEIRPVTSKNIKAPTVYEILKENGMNSILVNLPLSYPPKTDNITITSLLTQGDEFVFPSELKKEIPELNKYRIVPDPIYYVKFQKKGFIEDISDLEKTKFEIAKKLFTKKWNLFFILFSGTDWIQHKLYPDMVKDSKEKNQSILNFYKELDSYVGWFLENRDKNTTLIVMSDHGFKAYKGVIGLNNLLEKYGYLRFEKSSQKEVIPSRRLKEISDKQISTKRLKINPKLAKLMTKSRFITDMMKKIYQALFSKRISIQTEPKDLIEDFEHSKAFCLSGFSGIFIKKAYENIQEDLIEKLQKENLFSEIIQRTDVYHGPYVENAPHIILKPKGYTFLRKHFNIIVNKTSTGHDFDGIFLIDSPDIKRKQFQSREIIDIAPTILEILGINSKNYHLDGKKIL